MFITKIPFSFYLLTFIFLTQSAFGLAYKCLSVQNSTISDLYGTNLNELFSYLSYEVPANGFARGTKGHDADKVYGLTICNVDIEEKDCQSCIANATNEIRSLCPNSKGAIKWSQNCTLKYHNVDFFGHIDHETWFFTKDPQNLTDYQSIRQKKSEWLTQLAGQASINPPMVLFGQLDIGESNKLNGSVQCTRDLLSLDCMKCLSYSIGFLPKCCDSRKAVRLFSGTCELRFEAYYNKA